MTAQQTGGNSHMLFYLSAFAFYGFLVLSVGRVVRPAITTSAMKRMNLSAGQEAASISHTPYSRLKSGPSALR